MLRDGGTDNAMCVDEYGKDLEICGFVRIQNFFNTMTQTADIKYAENCNGHGICDISVGICHCHAGWSGFNCSEPEKPCVGLQTIKASYGSISDGYGVGRIYGNNINCTWIIEPEHQDDYGLPMIFTFVYFDMEAGFDAVELYDRPFVDINYKLKVMGVGGTFPKDRWAMPHSIVIGKGEKVAVNFLTDEANPSGIFYGFKLLFGRLDSVFVKALSYPLLAPGCNRKYGSGDSRCLDGHCTNCGVTLNEEEDNAYFMGSNENMCFSSDQASTVTDYNVMQDYYNCQDVLQNMWLKFTAGQTITMRVPCPRGFMKPPTGFIYDMPEYIVGSGPPEVRLPTIEEGQAYQRGFAAMDWWAECAFQCNNNRKNERYGAVFEDVPGKPGPIFAAQITAKSTSRATKLKGPYVQRPPSRVTGIQYGLENAKDNRTEAEKTSFALREFWKPTFQRFTTQDTQVEVELGQEYCEFMFTPTLPGIYQVNFFELRKDKFFDKLVQAVPFPKGMEHRTAVVMPGRTSPGHSKAFGPGLAYFQTTRSGIGVPFQIDSYDEYDNLRLVGGDQYIVALVHEHQEGQSYAEVSNIGNGSYYVVYNVTLSGRYSLHITLPALPNLCDNPRRVSLTNAGTEKAVRQMTGARCDVGTDFTVQRNQSDSRGPVKWCTDIKSKNPAAAELGEDNCVEYTYQLLLTAPWIPFGSPFSVWVDSGPITTSSVIAFGVGLSMGIAHYPTFFQLRIRDVFGNWASSLENITTGFEVPTVDQNMFHGSTTPTSLAAVFAGDETFQGDYFAEWQPYIAGEHIISVMLCNPLCIHIIGSPFHSKIYPAPSYGPNSTVHGNGIMDGYAGHARSFEIQDRDSALNRRPEGGEDFHVQLKGLSLADCPLVQNDVLLDVSRKCKSLYKSTLKPCNMETQQYMHGPEVSLNIAPSLTCLYTRNTADCREGCCPNGTADACSEFDALTTRSGFSPRSTGCAVRTCAFPNDCKFAMKRKQENRLKAGQDLIQTFVDHAHYRCPQIERLGLEAQMLMPPDERKDGQYNLIISNLEPFRPIWRGQMTEFEIQAWIKSHDLPLLYYSQTKNEVGRLYFDTYFPSTGHKNQIEGLVDEVASTQGR